MSTSEPSRRRCSTNVLFLPLSVLTMAKWVITGLSRAKKISKHLNYSIVISKPRPTLTLTLTPTLPYPQRPQTHGRHPHCRSCTRAPGRGLLTGDEVRVLVFPKVIIVPILRHRRQRAAGLGHWRAEQLLILGIFVHPAEIHVELLGSRARVQGT